MRKTLMTLALGCLALTAGAQATQQRANLVVDNRHEVVGEQHFQDIVFDLEANETIDGITLNAAEATPRIFTHGHYIVRQHITAQQAKQGQMVWVAFPTNMQADLNGYGTRWTAYSYNPQKPYSEAWEMVRPQGNRVVFTAGQGYQIRFSRQLTEDLEVVFTSVIGNFGTNDCRSNGLTRHYNAYAVGNDLNNLQLVGAPFMSKARLNTTDVRLAIPNELGGYDQFVSTDNATPDLAPFRSFFVQHTGDVHYKGVNNINLEMGPVTAHTVGDEFLNIELRGNNTSDRTVLWLTENGTLSYDAEADFAKLTSGNEQYATVYTLENGHRLAYNKMPMVKTTIPVGIRPNRRGTLTFSLNDMATSASQVVLHDKQLNTYTDLKRNSYTFTATEGVCDTRFEIELSFSPMTTPTIEADGHNGTLTVYTTEGGIVVNGLDNGAMVKLVDASGKAITHAYASGSEMTLPQLIPGIYMLMVNSNGETQGYKLTVK